MKKIIMILSFFGPKTSGCTITALNASILHQHYAADQNVAFLQLTTKPDLGILSGTSPMHNLLDMIPFLEEKEWSDELFSQMATRQVVDLFCMPFQPFWDSQVNEEFKILLEKFESFYDVLYIDLDDSVGEDLFRFVWEKSNQNILVLTLNPSSIETAKSFCKIFPAPVALVNQCPPEELKTVKKMFEHHQVDIAGALPFENKHMWDQVFGGIPLAFCKKSIFTKKLIPIVKNSFIQSLKT